VQPPQTVAPSAARQAIPLNLGLRLRPIIFGGNAAAPNAFAGGDPAAPPEHVLSVHSRTGCLLGYVVVDRTEAGRSLGGMTIAHDLDLSSTVALARTASLQLRFLELAAGACHCLLLVERDLPVDRLRDRREEYVDALRPLVAAHVCGISYVTQGTRLAPRIARTGLAASAAAATLAALEKLGIENDRATIALYRPGTAARELIRAISACGPRLVAEGPDALTAAADVVVVGQPLWSLNAEAAGTVRARAVVATGTTSMPVAAERRLREQQVVFIPATIAGAGTLLSLDLRARGLDERTAIRRTFESVQARARVALSDAAPTGRPLSAPVPDLAG
jgi:hypothetical protein